MNGLRDRKGQMTVELCVVIPVVIVLAAIVCNALAFFSYCAEFDRMVRNITRLSVVAPEDGLDVATAVGSLADQINPNREESNPSYEFEYEMDGNGFTIISAHLMYRPTFFGLQTRDSIFGVLLPVLQHTAQITVASDVAG